MCSSAKPSYAQGIEVEQILKMEIQNIATQMTLTRLTRQCSKYRFTPVKKVKLTSRNTYFHKKIQNPSVKMSPIPQGITAVFNVKL